MIRKLGCSDNLSGVDTPLFPLIYVNYNIVSFNSNGVYGQFNGDNRLVFLISIKGEEAILKSIGDYNAEEINYFLKMMNISSVISDTIYENIDVSFKEYNLLKLGAIKKIQDNYAEFLQFDSVAEDYIGVFSLFSDDEKAFPEWYADFGKKVMISCSVAGYVKDREKIVSAALVSGVFEKQAVISGVYTREEYRNRGLAGECVTAVTDKLLSMGVTDIYLWCEDSKLDFYKRLGYKKTSQIYIGECK